MVPRPKDEGVELVSDDVKHEGSPLMGSESAPNRRRQKVCSASRLAPVGLVLMVLSILGAIVVVFSHRPPNLQPQIDAAKAQVHKDEDGVYSVTYPTKAPPGMTYAELANRMLPPWYEATLIAVEQDLDNDQMQPSTVAKARKVLLMTRSLLDVFSPVYSEHSLWRELRKQFKHGYELVGYFQDLDHSGVDYNEELLEKRLKDVVDWTVGFALFRQEHHVEQFVFLGAKPDQCTRQKSSHLFWTDMPVLPCGSDSAHASVQNLAHVQLTNAVGYWQMIHNYTSVIPVEREEQFHNLRKELRIFLDEYKLFGDVLLEDPDEDALNILDEAQTKLGDINDAWTAYDIYTTEKTHKKDQEALAIQIDGLWLDFLTWASQNDLPSVMQSMLDMLSP